MANARFTIRPSKQSCYILGGIIVMLLAAGGGLYFWQKEELGKLQKQVAEKEKEMESSQRIAKRLERVERDYNERLGELRYLESSVSANEYVPTLLRQMEGAAKSSNLSVASVRPSWELAPEPPTDKEELKKFKPQPYDKLHVDMELRGSYWDIAKLVYRLTEFPKIIAVEGLTVQTKSLVVANKAPQLTAQIKVVGFVFNDANKPTEVEMHKNKPGLIKIIETDRKRKEASFSEASKAEK